MRRLMAVVAVVLGAAGMGVDDLSAAVRFQSPTGNLVCAILSDWEADAGVALALCQSRNDGFTVAVNAFGSRARGYPGGVGRQYSPVLRYGSSRSRWGLRCTSRYSGMTCVAIATGEGFFVNRDSWRWIG